MIIKSSFPSNFSKKSTIGDVFLDNWNSRTCIFYSDHTSNNKIFAYLLYVEYPQYAFETNYFNQNFQTYLMKVQSWSELKTIRKQTEAFLEDYQSERLTDWKIT